jgi:hypothetical protein
LIGCESHITIEHGGPAKRHVKIGWDFEALATSQEKVALLAPKSREPGRQPEAELFDLYLEQTGDDKVSELVDEDHASEHGDENQER